LFLNIDGEHLTNFVDSNHTTSSWVSSSRKDELVSQSLSVQKGASGDIVHVEESLLGDHKKLSILWYVLHEDWEVTWSLWSNLNLSRLSKFGSSWSRCTDFHDMEILDVLSLFLLGKAEKTILILSIIGDWNVSKASSTTFEKLLLLSLNEEKLHLAANIFLIWRVKSYQEAPFFRRVKPVRHDLSIDHLSRLVKDLLSSTISVHIQMVDRSLSNNTKLVLSNPFPV